MSIPKEPRQLMINVMYLVLTALLALNVSAEIFNAFDMVDKGLKSANKSLDDSNSKLPQLIKDGAKKKESLQTYADRVDGVRSTSTEATQYIQGLIDELIDKGGNRNGQVDEDDYITLVGGIKEIKGKRNYDPTTKLMVDAGKGEELKAKMLEVKSKFLSFVDEGDRAGMESALSIAIDDETWKLSANKKASWADFTFGHMPIGSTLPIFSKFINDVKASEAAVLNYLANKVGTTSELVFNKFKVVSSAKKSYVIKGEQYEADIFLSAAAGEDSKTGVAISVNGSPLRVDNEGVAKFTSAASAVGVKKYTATITLTNPVTGEKETVKGDFEYEVGERSVAISATKMNVFYIGVDNPIEVSAAGVPSGQIQVSMSGPGGGSITKNSDGTYNVKVTTPTPKGEFAKVNVTAPGMNASKEYRVKRIPDPIPMLGRERGGSIGDGTFKAMPGVFPILENFDFDARCEITDFLLIRSAKRSDPEYSPNQGGKYNDKSKSLVNKATTGDQYLFSDIKCKCPGDNASRNIGGMVFTIK